MKTRHIISTSCLLLASFISVLNANDTTQSVKDSNSPAHNAAINQDTKQKVRIDSKYTFEEPMKLSTQKDVEAIKQAQLKYIEKTYGKNYAVTTSFLMKDDSGRIINLIYIEKDKKDDYCIAIAFDVTEPMKTMALNDKEKFAKINKYFEGGAMSSNVVSPEWWPF